MLCEIPVEFLNRAAEDPAYCHRYDIVMRRFTEVHDRHRDLVLRRSTPTVPR